VAYIFPRLDAAVGSDLQYIESPWRIVLHTTEIASDPKLWVPNWRNPSHIVCDPVRKSVVQCLPLSVAAKSLYNAPGGTETNRLRCIQVEINGRAAEAGDWSEDTLRWLAAVVLAPVVRWVRSVGGDVDLTDCPPAGAIPGSASATAPQRMTFARWEAFGGICGHRHVPENDHWDAGALDTARLAALTTQALGDLGNPAAPTNPQEDPPVLIAYRVPDSTVYLVNVATGASVKAVDAFPVGASWSTIERSLTEMAAAGVLKTHAGGALVGSLGWEANWITRTACLWPLPKV
jgi:hypothetical protein